MSSQSASTNPSDKSPELNETLTRLQSLEQAWQDVGEKSKKLTDKIQGSEAAPAPTAPQSSELGTLDIVVERDAGPPVGLVLPAWKLRQMAREQQMKNAYELAKAEAEASAAAAAAALPPPPEPVSEEEFEAVLEALGIPEVQRPLMRSWDNDKKRTFKEAAANRPKTAPAPAPVPAPAESRLSSQSAAATSNSGRSLPPVAPPTSSARAKEEKKKRGMSLAGFFRRGKGKGKSPESIRSSSESSTRAMMDSDSQNLVDDGEATEPAGKLLEETSPQDEILVDDEDLTVPPEVTVPDWKVKNQLAVEDMNAQAMSARQEMLDEELLAPPALIVPDWKVMSQRKIQVMDTDARNAREESELEMLMAPPALIVPDWKVMSQSKFEEMNIQARDARQEAELDELMAPPDPVVPEWKTQNQLKIEEMEVKAMSARKEMLATEHSEQDGYLSEAASYGSARDPETEDNDENASVSNATVNSNRSSTSPKRAALGKAGAPKQSPSIRPARPAARPKQAEPAKKAAAPGSRPKPAAEVKRPTQAKPSPSRPAAAASRGQQLRK